MNVPEHPSDDFFREILSDHKIIPSPAAKKAFLEDAGKLTARQSRRRKGYLLLLTIALIVSAGLLFWIFSGIDPENTADNQNNQLSVDQNKRDSSSINVKSIPEELNQNEKQSITGQSGLTNVSINHTEPSSRLPESLARSRPNRTRGLETVSVPKADGNNSNPKDIARVPVADNSIADRKNSDSTIMTGAQLTKGPTVTGENSTHSAPGNDAVSKDSLYSEVISRVNLNKDSSIVNKRNLSRKDTTGKKVAPELTHLRKITFKIGVSYVPELMFNTLEGEKFVNTAGIEAVLKSGPFSLRTGVGISVSKGTNELSVAYNDWLGSYNRLDSILFTWNDPVKNYIPTIYLSRQEVWDSLMKLEYPKVIKRYCYLQIPLILGFDFWQNDRVTLGIRGGPILSVLLFSKELSETYNPGNKKIVSINGIPPEQVDLNWQVMAGFNTSIRLGRKFSLEVEPNISYYFNSVFEKPSTSWKPWSVGLRMSFLVGY